MAAGEDNRPPEDNVIPLVTKEELERHEAAAAAGVRILTLSDLDAVLLQLSQIRGMLDLIDSHTNLESNNGAMSALYVIREKTKIAEDILNSCPRVA